MAKEYTRVATVCTGVEWRAHRAGFASHPRRSKGLCVAGPITFAFLFLLLKRRDDAQALLKTGLLELVGPDPF